MMGNCLQEVVPEAQQLNSCPQAFPALAGLLVDKIARGVIIVNDGGFLTFMNRYAAEVLQVQKETVIGKRVDMLPLRTPLYKVLSEQCRDVPLEMVITGRIIAAQSTAVCSGDGVVQGELTELWDVTEERRSKRQCEEFVAMMAHDLRSPLSLILGYIQGILCGMYGEISSRLRTVVQKAEANGTKLNMMIEEMLDAYRLEVGLLNMNRQSCDLSKILAACYLDNLQTARTQSVSLVLTKNEGPLDLKVDSKQLSRAFNNLIGNAIKYTDAGGEVSIFMETVADTLHLAVADTGIGIPPEDLPRIFYKYYRSDGASRFKGTGLGLAICKDIIEAHGGSIGVESTLGEGSRFKVMIPLTAMERIKSGPAAQGEQSNGR